MTSLAIEYGIARLLCKARKNQMMVHNVGLIDRVIRAVLAALLLWLGIFKLGGQDGAYIGILVTTLSFIFIYACCTGSCILLKYLQIHTLTRKERAHMGDPYNKRRNSI